jgi:RNA polymerase sigma factor (sigma-70 family)
MSPLHLRRYRAERLLQRQFDALRGRVLATVRQRLHATGLTLDQCDLDACYAQAWQGLYTATLDGQDIANPAGWLMLVTFRRAIEQHRGQHHEQSSPQLEHDAHPLNSCHPDPDAELDHRAQLQQLFEGISSRLTPREREAATLCYLQGLSRAQAAAHMGITDARMRKLMEGRGPGRPGVASKVGALVHTIRQGDWCHEQGSLMRALAYGILDPQGERYQLALTHHRQCPACRAYVVSLRGLAAALPPVFLPSGLAAAVLARVAHGIHAGGRAAGAAGSGSVAGGASAGAAVSASGAAGAGSAAAGGGWLIGAGPLTAKLAAGCLLALGLGAGCVALDTGHHTSLPRHRSHLPAQPENRLTASALDLAAVPLSTPAGSAAGAPAGRASTPLTPAARASREFGPEQALAGGAGGAQPASDPRSVGAVAASARAVGSGSGSGSSGGGGSADVSAGGGSQAPSSTPAAGGDSAAAEREFSPG